MPHKFYKVESFEIVAPYTLKVLFDDGVIQVINFESVLHGEIYGPLQDLKLFNQVKIDSKIKTLVWPNDADFDPKTLHDWPDYAEQFKALAKSWSRASSKSH